LANSSTCQWDAIGKKIMPSFQEYLISSEYIHANLPFIRFYTLWYRSWPKEFDVDYFKITKHELKKD